MVDLAYFDNSLKTKLRMREGLARHPFFVLSLRTKKDRAESPTARKIPLGFFLPARPKKEKNTP